RLQPGETDCGGSCGPSKVCDVPRCYSNRRRPVKFSRVQMGVYFQAPEGQYEFRETFIFKERPMDSKKRNRRGFLKDSAALAGLAAGGARLAKGQTPGTPPKKIDELIAYGERSRFVTSIRVPVAE